MNFRHLERIVRGFSNHRRIEILSLLKENPELSVLEISGKLNIDLDRLPPTPDDWPWLDWL